MFLTPERREQLLANGLQSARDVEDTFDPLPVVELSQPDGAATWLLTEFDPDEPGLACGLVHRVDGVDDVRLSKIAANDGPIGLAVGRDRAFRLAKLLTPCRDATRIASVIAG